MRRLPDVIASYVRDGDRYQRVGRLGRMSARELVWWAVARAAADRHDGALAYGPDVVGLLRDDVSYGVAGDHGGHQEKIQRIPMVFSLAGAQAAQARASRSARSTSCPTVLS